MNKLIILLAGLLCLQWKVTAQTTSIQLLSPNVVEVYQEQSWPQGTYDYLLNSLAAATNPLSYSMTVNGQPVGIASVGVRRRPASASLYGWNITVGSSLYLTTTAPIDESASVAITGSLPGVLNATVAAQFSSSRTNPAIHVSYAGYAPSLPKSAMVGCFLGTQGELPAPTGSFYILDTVTAQVAYTGTLIPRKDVGLPYMAYQNVVCAQFDDFQTPGTYRIYIPGYGCSHPFRISDDYGALLARTYAQGMLQQRCGYDVEMPFTRFSHGLCHTRPVAKIDPSMAAAESFIAAEAAGVTVAAPSMEMTNSVQSYFPFCNTNPVDVSGGHHDAGDYSKYMVNCVALAHILMTAVDSFPNVASLDNLGIPESGDGIPDVLQEAKWELDFILKMQDTDGGFFCRVYPQNRRYEADCLPEAGDNQIVFPKNTASTAGGVAALAQAASSAAMKYYYPQAAADYLKAAMKGYQFLQNAFNQYGEAGAYQQIGYTYWGYKDNLAWAYAELYLATTNTLFQDKLIASYTPGTRSTTWRWGWWRMSEGYGRAARSYGLAVQSGKMDASHLDPNYLALCQQEITGWANCLTDYAQKTAYGTSWGPDNKRNGGAGWYFSSDQAFEIAVGLLLNQDTNLLAALASNLAYETGCNPRNQTYLIGIGPDYYHNLNNLYSQNARRQDPPTGIPVGNLQGGFPYMLNYTNLLGKLCWPLDGTTAGSYPLYDRGGDVASGLVEQIGPDQARALAVSALLMANSSKATQPWSPKNTPLKVTPYAGSAACQFSPVTDGNIVSTHWESFGDESGNTPGYTHFVVQTGDQWIESEFTTSDGRRYYGTNLYSSAGPVIDGAPTVSIVAINPVAIYNTAQNGLIRISRSTTAGTMTLGYNLSGVSNGGDVVWLNGNFNNYVGSATITNGADHVDIPVIAKQQPGDYSTKTLKLTLIPGNVNIQYPGYATVQIVRNATSSTTSTNVATTNAPSANVRAVYWTGLAGDNKWSNPANWSPNVVPGATIAATITAPATINIANGDCALAITNTAANVVLTGGLLTVPAITTVNPLQLNCTLIPATTLMINGSVIIGGSILVTNGAWVQNGNVTVNPGCTFTFARLTSTTMTLNGNLVNNGGNINVGGVSLKVTGQMINNSGSVNLNNASFYPNLFYTAGTFNLNGGFVNSTNPWTVVGNTTIALTGTNNHFYMQNSTNMPWTGTVQILNWINDPNSRITMGGTQYGATAAQLGAITYPVTGGYYKAAISAYGWITPNTGALVKVP